jgi:hypothetical protein
VTSFDIATCDSISFESTLLNVYAIFFQTHPQAFENHSIAKLGKNLYIILNFDFTTLVFAKIY